MIKSKVKSQNQNSKFKIQNFEFYLVVLPFTFLLFTFLCGCEQVDTETLNKITQEDPAFKSVLTKKQELDARIGAILNQLRDIKTDVYARIRALEENYTKQKRDADSKVTALKNELEPERSKIRQEMEDLRGILASKKDILKTMGNTRRNLTNLINQQRAVSVTKEDMEKWQERLSDLDKQIEPLAGEVRELEEKLRILRLKLIALRQ